LTGRGEPDGAAAIEEQYRAARAAIDASYEAYLNMLREFRENPFADDPLWWYKPLWLNEELAASRKDELLREAEEHYRRRLQRLA